MMMLEEVAGATAGLDGGVITVIGAVAIAVIGAIAAAAVQIIKAFNEGRNVMVDQNNQIIAAQHATVDRDVTAAAKADHITLLVDGRYSDVVNSHAGVIQELADVKKILAQITNKPADIAGAKQEQVRADTAQAVADKDAAQVTAAAAAVASGQNLKKEEPIG